MARKVIDLSEIPTKPPIIGTLVWWLVLERLDAPGWVLGAMGLVLVVGWVAWMVDVSMRESVKVIK